MLCVASENGCFMYLRNSCLTCSLFPSVITPQAIHMATGQAGYGLTLTLINSRSSLLVVLINLWEWKASRSFRIILENVGYYFNPNASADLCSKWWIFLSLFHDSTTPSIKKAVEMCTILFIGGACTLDSKDSGVGQMSTIIVLKY